MSGFQNLHIELVIENFNSYNNLFLCNRKLYAYSTVTYLKKGHLLDQNLPNIQFMVCPSDSGYGNVLNNIILYVVICNKTKEYILCTLQQIVPFLYGMNGKHSRWKSVIMYPYIDTRCLLHYGLCGYNFAMLDYDVQTDNCKYICDPSLLKNGKYNRRELLKIAEILGIKIKNNMSKYKLQNLLYTAM